MEDIEGPRYGGWTEPCSDCGETIEQGHLYCEQCWTMERYRAALDEQGRDEDTRDREAVGPEVYWARSCR